jgi:mono/diheme cytochrome c family protein
MFRTTTLAAASVMAVCSAVAAQAQDAALGETIYADRCAVCHGDSGAGDGMVGVLFAQPPKDLKLLSRENGGVFPFMDVVQAIDGRAEIDAHGRSEMPVWGTYFMQEAIDNPAINPKNARYITEGRILALTYYLQTMQVD